MLTTHNIDIQAMLVWLTLPFYDFCGFRSVAVNSAYELQFFYIYHSVTETLVDAAKSDVAWRRLILRLQRQIGLRGVVPQCFSSAVLVQYRRVTDRQTDRHTITACTALT